MRHLLAQPPVMPAAFADGDTLHLSDRRFVHTAGGRWIGHGPHVVGDWDTDRVVRYLTGEHGWQARLLQFEPAPAPADAPLPGQALADLPQIPPSSLWLPYQADDTDTRLTLLRESMRQLTGDALGMPYTLDGHQVAATLHHLLGNPADAPGFEISRRPQSGALYARWRPGPPAALVTTVVYIPATTADP